MKHISEEEMVEQYYGVDDSAAKEHLAKCAECAQSYAALEADLRSYVSLEAPKRDGLYGQRVWQSIAGSLPAYARRKPVWQRLGVWQALSYASACALLVACAFYAGRLWEHRQPNPTAQVHPAPKQKPVILVVLGDHLDRSERLLVELKHADPESPETVSPIKDEAKKLLAENRACRQDAARIGDPALALALERLDHLLTELASKPEGLDAAAIEKLQRELNEGGLLFEVRVLRSRIPDQQMVTAATRSEGTI